MRGAGMVVILMMVCTLIIGCGQEKINKPNEKLVDRVNNYEITADDFKAETKLAMPDQYPAGKAEAMKKDILDEMITKAVLVQEAQLENFDKDRAFMKEIEGYWEQALLKLLIRKKAEELAEKISVSDEEIKSEYDRLVTEEGAKIGSFQKAAPEISMDIRNRKIQAALGDWIAELKKKSKIKVYNKNLEDIKVP